MPAFTCLASCCAVSDPALHSSLPLILPHRLRPSGSDSPGSNSSSSSCSPPPAPSNSCSELGTNAFPSLAQTHNSTKVILVYNMVFSDLKFPAPSLLKLTISYHIGGCSGTHFRDVCKSLAASYRIPSPDLRTSSTTSVTRSFDLMSSTSQNLL